MNAMISPTHFDNGTFQVDTTEWKPGEPRQTYNRIGFGYEYGFGVEDLVALIHFLRERGVDLETGKYDPAQSRKLEK